MKILTKHVVLENEEFVLIQDEHEGQIYYGTIPYTELDENGKMKRPLNGFEIAISFDSIGDALNNRVRKIKQRQLFYKYLIEGMDQEQAHIYSILNA